MSDTPRNDKTLIVSDVGLAPPDVQATDVRPVDDAAAGAAGPGSPSLINPPKAPPSSLATSQVHSRFRAGDEPIPGYSLIRFLGKGGFGEVWMAAAPGGAHIALKFMGLDSKGGQKEFRSLGLVKRIQHANLIPIMAFWLKDETGQFLPGQMVGDSGEVRPTTLAVPSSAPQRLPAELIIAMGLGHKSLADRLEECKAKGLKGIPPAELIHYMHDAARAIDYLNSPRHDLGNGPIAIQHCDIKPLNLLIVGDAVQVCDFGLARVLGDMRQTSAGASLAYAAPECLERNQPSSATDQYSLAITYFELRTGTLPFGESPSVASVFNAHMTGNFDLSALPEKERVVIKKAISRDPSQRFTSAVEMVEALGRAVGQDLVREEAPRRRSVASWLLPIVIGTAAVAVALAVGLRRTGDPVTIEPPPPPVPTFHLSLPQQVALDAGGSTTFAVRVERHAFDAPVTTEFTTVPPGLKLDIERERPDADDFQVRLTADSTAAPGEKTLQLAASGGDLSQEASLRVIVHAAAVWVPEGYVADPDSGFVAYGGRNYPHRMRCVRHGLDVPFVFVPRNRADDPAPFFIMENKVTNELFRKFAEANPKAVEGSKWELGGVAKRKELGATNPRHPVVRVNFAEAWACAVWLGGRIPTVEQWDKAAGRFEEHHGLGPFRESADGKAPEVAVARAETGPADAGSAASDVSPFGIRDMAGNGREWTRTSIEAGVVLPLTESNDLVGVILRGRSYAAPTPLLFSEMNDPLRAESQFYTDRDAYTGFRVVFDDLPP
jgi:serine/threonine protein kinase